MFDLLISLAVVALLFASALAGHWIVKLLPEAHRSERTREFTKLASGLLVTFAALVRKGLVETGPKVTTQAVGSGAAGAGPVFDGQSRPKEQVAEAIHLALLGWLTGVGC